MPLRANSDRAGGTEVRLDVPEPVALDLAPAPTSRSGRLRGRRPADRRQAGRARRPSVARVTTAARWSTPCWRARAVGYGGIAGVARPGIVHRLDRDTSGLLMVAKHDAAQASLMAQLKARRVRKTYLALVAGNVCGGGRPHRGADRARPEAPEADGGRARWARLDTGYRVRERFAGWTLLELDLVTGRTHQIRVHLDAIGHPVAGDPVYGTGTSRAARTASTGCSSTPGGWSSSRRPGGADPRRRAAAATSSRRARRPARGGDGAMTDRTGVEDPSTGARRRGSRTTRPPGDVSGAPGRCS